MKYEKAISVLGISHIIIGILLTVYYSAAHAKGLDLPHGYLALDHEDLDWTGIFGGILTIIAGILGIRVARRGASRGRIAVVLGLAILTALGSAGSVHSSSVWMTNRQFYGHYLVARLPIIMVIMLSLANLIVSVLVASFMRVGAITSSCNKCDDENRRNKANLVYVALPMECFVDIISKNRSEDFLHLKKHGESIIAPMQNVNEQRQAAYGHAGGRFSAVLV